MFLRRPTPGAPSGCASESSVACSLGTGWSCQAGDNAEAEVSGLSCSDPMPSGPNDNFCCFEWTYGSTCTPDDNLRDSSLNCSNPTPDGSDNDFCCQ